MAGEKENDRKYSSHELERPINDSRGKAGYGFPVSRSPHWQLQYRLAQREFEVVAERGVSWHANSKQSFGLERVPTVLHLPREHVPPVASDHSLRAVDLFKS
ncbi:hypothetical protein V1477_012015 [Vespula maculifrons]|uniref:Uncharacterized protein n=2 Tax=Vespula TaxID=7451 RepID=A0A834JF72_VESVU|nr:hypothetical protein HZH66_011043 [Vespula vulgaris]